MKHVVTFFALLIAGVLGCRSVSTSSPASTANTVTAAPNAPAPNLAASPTPKFLTQMRQLTFEGTRSGEGYFSRDGKLMTFQSEREPGNPFYQQYVMNMQTGATHRVSPGNGKTSCGWIHPDSKHVLFSSTHEDPDWKAKAEAEYTERQHPKQRYSWNFDEHFDIYTADMDGKHLKNLTHTKGYDAEGSYSPDGKWIAFASNRAAYNGSMSTADAAVFAKDPSYMMDIYIMRADGSGVKRLTQEPGYDGGPFFSPDGKRLTYRHFSADGRTAEVFTMNVDGSDKRQLTHLGVMSWAPFYHPSGDYLIFASNKFGHANFELFIVDSNGKHEPVRVTELEGFDGLPVFTPDGHELVWAHANEKGESQLYRAQWSDDLARAALELAPKAPTLKTMTPAITAADAREWVEYLANPYFEGRQTGNPKEMEYVQTLAQAMKDMGLQAQVQTYDFTSGIELGANNHFNLQLDKSAPLTLIVGKDWIPLSYSQAGTFAQAPLVFAGYGIVANASAGQAAFDSYAGLDVHDKWVVVFSGLPQNIPNERRYFLSQASHLQAKAMTARQRGARGLIVIEDTGTPSPELKVSFEGRSDAIGLPVVRVAPQIGDRMFAAVGSSRAELTRKLSDGTAETLTWPTGGAQAEVDLKLLTSKAHNVLGLLRVPGATSTVIVGAHLDHLGHGERGTSLAPSSHAVHPGADDNASGVAGVMEVAHALTHSRHGLNQNILFALWTGEEIGILGSSHFANTNEKYKLSASVNMDMIGRYRDGVFAQGLGSAPQWRSLIEQFAARSGDLVIHPQDDPYLPSDALTFYMKKLPSIMFFTGSHAQYHTPDDKADTINYDGLAKVAGLAERLTRTLAAAPTSPVTYQKVEGSPKGTQPARGFRLFLGTIPDYTRDLKQGVAITGTSKNSPAEKAGLVAGDVIVELGGIKVGNLYDYVYCLQSLKANEKTKIRILRAGKEQELEITPQAKVE